MSLQIRFGIAGAALGLLIGLIGAISAGVPFGILLLRILLALVFGGILGLVLYVVVARFLPELVSEEQSGGDELSPLSGQSVDITLSDDASGVDYREAPAGAPEPDQAEALRRTSRYSETEAAEGGSFEDEMIEEVSEDRRARKISADVEPDVSFNESAFYDGVQQLPDIGGFSEQFQAADQGNEEDAGAVTESYASSSSPGSGKSKGETNMNPQLIAQAIRTALKKEDL